VSELTLYAKNPNSLRDIQIATPASGIYFQRAILGGKRDQNECAKLREQPKDCVGAVSYRRATLTGLDNLGVGPRAGIFDDLAGGRM
jgi:hypothetical protein